MEETTKDISNMLMALRLKKKKKAEKGRGSLWYCDIKTNTWR